MRQRCRATHGTPHTVCVMIGVRCAQGFGCIHIMRRHFMVPCYECIPQLFYERAWQTWRDSAVPACDPKLACCECACAGVGGLLRPHSPLVGTSCSPTCPTHLTTQSRGLMHAQIVFHPLMSHPLIAPLTAPHIVRHKHRAAAGLRCPRNSELVVGSTA